MADSKANVKADHNGKQITEGKVTLAPGVSTEKVFYNPVQEFNRDLSCLVLSVFFEKYKIELEQKRLKKSPSSTALLTDAQSASDVTPSEPVANFEGFTIFEAMAASGLRACRYALEVPHVKIVVANDINEAACEAIRLNAAHNGCSEKVVVTTSDAKVSMYQAGYANPQRLFHAVDLDPFGSAAPFIEGAIQCISEGGLLLVTCTDTSILCGNFPEACYARYGATAVRNPAHHEISLRIVLHCVASRAMMHEKYVQPLLSVREGHYVRLFMRIHRGAKEAKENVRKTSYIYNCTVCHSFYLQPICDAYKTAYVNAAIGSSNVCEICGTVMKIGGPIWSGPLHDAEFLSSLTTSLESDMTRFGTAKVLQGKLGMIQEELPDQPLFIVAKEIFKVVHCEPIPSKIFLSAILHAGFRFSVSHCEAEAIKTDIPFRILWDIIRNWVETHPVAPIRLNEPKVHKILSVPSTNPTNFEIHPEADFNSRKRKLLRFPTGGISGPMAKPKLSNLKEKEDTSDPSPELKKIRLQ